MPQAGELLERGGGHDITLDSHDGSGPSNCSFSKEGEAVGPSCATARASATSFSARMEDWRLRACYAEHQLQGARLQVKYLEDERDKAAVCARLNFDCCAMLQNALANAQQVCAAPADRVPPAYDGKELLRKIEATRQEMCSKVANVSRDLHALQESLSVSVEASMEKKAAENDGELRLEA